jgi:hypothetical protein
MKLKRDAAGDLTVDADLLSQRFNIPPPTLRRLMAQGHVRGRVESGLDEDAGRCRISLRCGNRIWQAVLATDGEIEAEELRHVRPGRGPWHGGT